MADGKIEIDIDVNDSGASAKGKKAGEEISKGVESGLKNVGKTAESAAKDTEKSFKSAADSAKSSFSDVGSAAKSGFSDVGDAAKTAAGDASSAFENVPSDASGAFSDVSSEAKAGFDGVTDAAKTAADDTASAFDGVGDEIASDIDGVDDKAQGVFGTNIPASTAIAGAAVGVLASQILDIGKNAVNTGMEFDKSMSQVAATMGKTTDEVQDLRKFAQEMGETTAFSASQSADALNYMALAGYDAETSMRVLPTVLNLAAAGNMDLARASDMVTDAQSALGLSVDEAETMVDQMAKTSSKTNTSVEQLGDAFLTVGGTAKNLKGGTAELSEMLGILADNGVKGSEGGTALRNVILSLSAPTDKAAGAIKDLGLEVFDAEGNMRSMPDIMNDMNAAMADMSQEKRTNVLNDIFNKVDLKSVNALLGTSADRFDEVADAIDNSAGAAQQMAETQLDNLAGDVTLLQSATEGFYQAISDALNPALRGLTQFGTNTLMPFLTESVKNFDKIAPAVLAAVTAIVVMTTKGKAVSTLNTIFDTLKVKVAGSTTAFNQMDAAAKRSAISTKALSVASKALATAAPILAITALVEAGTLLYQTWKKDKEHTEKLTKATSGLESAATNASFDISSEADAVDDLSGAFERVDIDDFLDKHSQLADSIKDTNLAASTSQAMLDDYADTINRLAEKSGITEPELAELKNAVTQVNDALGTNYEVTEGGGGAYQIMADGVKVAKDEILKLIEAQKAQVRAEADMENYKATYQQWQEDLQKTAEAKAKVEEASKKLAQAEKDAQTASDPVARAKASADMAKYGQAIKDAEKDLEDIEATTGSTESAMNRLNERTNLNTMAMADNASALVKNAAANQEFISGVQGSAVKLDDFVVALQDMGYTADDVASMNQDSAMKLAQAWKDGYDITKTETDKTVDDVVKRLNDMGKEAYDAANKSGEQGGEGFADGVKSTEGETKNSAQSLVNTAENTLGSGDASQEGQELGGSFASGVGQKEGEARGESSKLGNAATSELDKSREAERSGSFLTQGFIAGIGSKLRGVIDAARNVASAAINAIKQRGEEGSPWKTTYRSGIWAAQGLIKGIISQNKKAKKSASELSQAVVDGASKKLSNLKGVYNISAEYELGYWRKVMSNTKKWSDAWYKAWGNVVDAQKRRTQEINDNYNKIISSAETWLERYKLTHDMTLKQEVKYWKRRLGQVKKGSEAYYTALAKVKEAEENYYNGIVDNANTYLDRYKLTHNISVQSEMNYWKRILKQTKRGSEQWYEVYSKYVELRKSKDSETLSNAEKWLEHYEITHNVSLKTEERYWKKYLNKVKKGSDEYYTILAKIKDIRAEQKEQQNQYYNDLISNAQTWLDRYKLTHDVSLKTEWNYWKKKLKQTKKGTDAYYDALSRVKEAEKNYYDGIVSNATQYLERRKLTSTVSLKSEWNYWKEKLKLVKKGSDQYYEILSNAKSAEESYYDGVIAGANNYVSRQKRLYNLSAAQERDYWATVLKKVKKGSSQYQEAYDNYLEAKKEAAAEVNDRNSDLLDAEQSFVNKLRDIQQQLTDDIKAAKDAYAEAVKERKQSILSDLNTFEIYRKKVTISGEKLIENVKSQVAATKDYETAMKKLEGRIGKGDLYNEIADMGMEGLRYAESLNKMTDAQIKEFTKLYAERNAIAQREATRESKDLLTETNNTIKQLNEQAAKDIKSAANDLKKEAADLGTTLANTVAKMANSVKASANSINSSINSAINSLKKLDSRVSTTSTSSTRSYAMEPSQGTQIPISTVYNGRQVITDDTGAIQGYSLLSTDLYGATRQTEVSLLRGMEALTMAMRDSRAIGGDTYHEQNITFAGSISSPDEIARTMRMQQHYGLAGQYS